MHSYFKSTRLQRSEVIAALKRGRWSNGNTTNFIIRYVSPDEGTWITYETSKINVKNGSTDDAYGGAAYYGEEPETVPNNWIRHWVVETNRSPFDFTIYEMYATCFFIPEDCVVLQISVDENGMDTREAIISCAHDNPQRRFNFDYGEILRVPAKKRIAA